MAEIGRASVVFETVGADKVREDVASLNQEMSSFSSASDEAASSTGNMNSALVAAAGAAAIYKTRTQGLTTSVIQSFKASREERKAYKEQQKTVRELSATRKHQIKVLRDLERQEKQAAKAVASARASIKKGNGVTKETIESYKKLNNLGKAQEKVIRLETEAKNKAANTTRKLEAQTKKLASASEKYAEKKQIAIEKATKFAGIIAVAGSATVAAVKAFQFLATAGERANLVMQDMAERVQDITKAYRDLNFIGDNNNPFEAIDKQANEARQSFFEATQALRNEAEEFIRQGPGLIDAAVGLFTTSNYEAQVDAYNSQLDVLERKASAVSKRIEDERKRSQQALKDQTLLGLFEQRRELELSSLDELEQAQERAFLNQSRREKEIQDLKKRGQYDIAEATRLLAEQEAKNAQDAIDAIKDRQSAEEESRRKQERDRQQREAEANLAKQLDLLRKTIEGQAKLQSDIRDQMISLNNTFTNFSPSIEKIGEYAGRIY